MKKLANFGDASEIVVCSLQSALAFPPTVFGAVPAGWANAGVVPEFDIEIWNSTTGNLTLAELFGAVTHPGTIADDTVESVDVGANTLTLTTHGLTTGDGPVRLTAGTAVAATGTLTLTGNAVATETVTIGSTVYTWRAAAGAEAFAVTIGIDASGSLDNLIAAINDSGVEGVNYGTGTTPHPSVTAAAGAGDTMDITAITAGSAGNSIATTEAMADGAWGNATMTGGVDAGVPGGLAIDTDYWVIRSTANAIQLATSKANAFALTAIDLTNTNGAGSVVLSDTVDTERTYWHSLGLLGQAEDGAVTLTSQRAYATRARHRPRVAAYGLVATIAAGTVSASMYPVLESA